MSIDEMAEDASIDAATAAAITVATGGTMALGKGGWNFAKARLATVEDAKSWGLSEKQANQVIDEVNTFLRQSGSDSQVKMTGGKRSSDVVTRSREADLRNREEFAQRFVEQDAKDNAALNEGIDILSRPEMRPYANMDMKINDAAANKLSQNISKQEHILARNQDELTNRLTRMDKTQKERVGGDTRDYILAKRKVAKEAEDNAWGSVRQLGEYDAQKQAYNLEIPVAGDLKGFREVLRNRMNTAQTKVESKGVSGLLKAQEKGYGNQVKTIKAPLKDIKLRNTTQLAKETKPQDLADYSRELSNLKAELRAAKANKQFGTTSTKDMDDYIKLMERNRNEQLIEMGRPDLVDAIQAAERQTRRFHEIYNRSVIGDLTKVNDKGIPVVSSHDFVDKILKGDPEQAVQLKRVINKNPELMVKWKQGLANTYKRKVCPEGKCSPRMSKEFIEQNRPVLSEFFTDRELKTFAKTPILGKKVAEQAAKLKKFKADSAHWGVGKIASTDTNGLVKFITGDAKGWKKPGRYTPDVQGSLSKIKYVKNRLASYPEALQSLENDFKSYIRKDVMNPKTGTIDANAMLKWVSDKGNAETIKSMLGADYFNNLVKINNATQVMNSTMSRLAGEETAQGIIQSIRAAGAPPLTRRGRAFTAILTFNSNRAHRIMADIMLDDKKIADLAKIAEHKKLTRETAELAASLGFVVPFTEE
jgi:hypothetical protein